MGNWRDRESKILGNMERKWNREDKRADKGDSLHNPKHPDYNSLENQIKRAEEEKLRKEKEAEERRSREDEEESRYTGIPDRKTYKKNLDAIAAKEAARGKKS